MNQEEIVSELIQQTKMKNLKTLIKNTMKIKHSYSGSSLLEIRNKFGISSNGFFDNSWFLDEPFAKEKPEVGIYEIDIEKKLTNLTFAEQKSKLEKGWDFPHPAVLVEAILTHYKSTGERLLKDWYSRTSLVDSDGYRVDVGSFDSGGLVVSVDWDIDHDDGLGLASCKKIGKGSLKNMSVARKSLEVKSEKCGKPILQYGGGAKPCPNIISFPLK